MSICTGPELGPFPTDGSLHVRNVQPLAWPGTYPGACQPSAVSDLHKDPALGLWVPPVDYEILSWTEDTQSIEVAVGFGTWEAMELNLVPFPASPCISYQMGIVSTFLINATVPQNTGVSWVIQCDNTPMTGYPPPPTALLEHGRFEGFADSAVPSGTLYQMARTDTVQRFLFNPIGTAQTLYQAIAFTAFENGSGLATPTLTRVKIDTVVYRFNAVAGYNGPQY